MSSLVLFGHHTHGGHTCSLDANVVPATVLVVCIHFDPA